MTPTLLDSGLGHPGTFAMFALFASAGFLFLFKFVPETKGLSECEKKELFLPGAKYGRKLNENELSLPGIQDGAEFEVSDLITLDKMSMSFKVPCKSITA